MAKKKTSLAPAKNATETSSSPSPSRSKKKVASTAPETPPSASTEIPSKKSGASRKKTSPRVAETPTHENETVVVAKKSKALTKKQPLPPTPETQATPRPEEMTSPKKMASKKQAASKKQDTSVVVQASADPDTTRTTPTDMTVVAKKPIPPSSETTPTPPTSSTDLPEDPLQRFRKLRSELPKPKETPSPESSPTAVQPKPRTTPTPRKASEPTRDPKKSTSQDPPRDARKERDPEREKEPREKDGLPPGMVRVRQFHPDVVPGGGYIERVVPKHQIPLGAEIITSSAPSTTTPATDDTRKKRDTDKDNSSTDSSLLPTGGILAAGRRLISEGRLSIRKDSQETTPTSPANPTTSTEQVPAPDAKTSPSNTTPNVSMGTVAPVKGVGSSFLEGLPTRPTTPLTASAAKQALQSVFGGPSTETTPTTQSQTTPKITPTATPVAPSPSPVSTAASPSPSASPSSSSSPSPSASVVGGVVSGGGSPATSRGRGGMILDGRVVENEGTTQEQAVKILSVTPLPSAHKHLQIYELQIQTEKNRSLQAHLFLWPEGKFSIQARINDNDPRPQVLAEEGIRGLGMEDRLEELQRWSVREWWDHFTEKGQQPMAAWSGTQVIRLTQQVAFVHDPAYQVFRLYQARKHTLAGNFPLLRIHNGRLSFAYASLDGVDEKERITPARMQDILKLPAGEELPSLIHSAIPFYWNNEPVALRSAEHFALFRDQLEYFFQFPILRFPDPLGGTGSIRLHLGLWEMSQNTEMAAQMRNDAIQERMVTFRASAGYISDLVRRELWRKKEQPARLWGGYTPKHVLDTIRDDLYEDFRNMQGFQPKNPGDFQYNPENGEFQIVLRRRRCNHTLLLQGKQKKTPMLGVITMYGNQKREGLDPLVDYTTLLHDPQWQDIAAGIQWNHGWMMAPAEESRCLWAEHTHRPVAPVVRHMPPWHRGIALGLFLLDQENDT